MSYCTVLLWELVFFVAIIENLEFNFTCLLKLTIRNFTEEILLKQVNFQSQFTFLDAHVISTTSMFLSKKLNKSGLLIFSDQHIGCWIFQKFFKNSTAVYISYKISNSDQRTWMFRSKKQSKSGSEKHTGCWISPKGSFKN